MNRIDLAEYTEEFNYAKKSSISRWDDNYHLAYYKTLNYVVPIAFQSEIALHIDLEGNRVNDKFNNSPKYKVEHLQICIFPLDGYSVIMMFVRKKVKRYTAFFKQLKKLDFDNQLATINHLIFLYSEDFFVFIGIDNTIIENKQLRKVAQTSEIFQPQSIFENDPTSDINTTFNLNKRNGIPNLLHQNFKLSK